MTALNCDVRFYPKSGHQPAALPCPLSANSGAVLAVEHVERAVVLVAYINPRAVRSERDAVHRLRTLEHLHYLVGRGIDHVDAVAGAVGDLDADQLSAGRARDRKGGQSWGQPEEHGEAGLHDHGSLHASGDSTGIAPTKPKLTRRVSVF